MIRLVAPRRCIFAIVLPRCLVAFGVDLAGIVLLSFFRIRQDIVGALYRLERVFRRRIAGIEVGMMFLGEPAIRLEDDVGRCIAGDAKNGV